MGDIAYYDRQNTVASAKITDTDLSTLQTLRLCPLKH